MSLYVARSSAVAARSLGEEMVIMSTRDSTLFTLNEVAAEIWQAADGRTPLSEIVEKRICAKFDTTPPTAYADAETVCRKLAEHGILLLSDHPFNSVRDGS